MSASFDYVVCNTPDLCHSNESFPVKEETRMQLGKSRSRYYFWWDRFLRKRYFCTWCGAFFSNWLFFSVFG